MPQIAFRADDATRAAIEKLTRAAIFELPPGLVPAAARGVAIRKALIEAAARLDKEARS